MSLIKIPVFSASAFLFICSPSLSRSDILALSFWRAFSCSLICLYLSLSALSAFSLLVRFFWSSIASSWRCFLSVRACFLASISCFFFSAVSNKRFSFSICCSMSLVGLLFAYKASNFLFWLSISVWAFVNWPSILDSSVFSASDRAFCCSRALAPLIRILSSRTLSTASLYILLECETVIILSLSSVDTASVACFTLLAIAAW